MKLCKTIIDYEHDDYCEKYTDNGEYCSNCAERAYDNYLDHYYGNNNPVTLDEKHRKAWEGKRKLK